MGFSEPPLLFSRLDGFDPVARIELLDSFGALAYDQQTLLARIVRLETEIILLQAKGSYPE